jgi:hypothetical protein
MAKSVNMSYIPNWTSPTSQPEPTEPRTDAPQNGPIFTRKPLQPEYNPTTRHLQIRKNFNSITSVTIVPYENHKIYARIALNGSAVGSFMDSWSDSFLKNGFSLVGIGFILPGYCSAMC